ncbi:hypothetical protein BGZ70_004248 [Mortierella alpina]|uniref:Uncharacterized protein n=1 Tax=Mortierella alpina TaxID=64518 RepID=A0A9P6IR61_MORAP|nr:hypothetical protein BGZ70_004248 [Mortierella alpina]
MGMDEDSSQGTPGTEDGGIAELTLKKDNVETEGNYNILVVADTTHTSPFERIKALAQRIPPSPSMINRQRFPCPPVYPMQHIWPYPPPPPAYYPGPAQMPHQGYHVPYGPCVPYYDYRQVPFNGYSEYQQYVDTHSPGSWACVPYRREQHATDHSLPGGSERDLHPPTPDRDVAAQSPGQSFERQSSSESTPRLSSASPSMASPEQCLAALFVPPLPPGEPLAVTAPRLSVSPLSTPEPLSHDGTVEKSADKTIASPSPPARFRKPTMKEKFTLDQNKIKRIAEISKQMLEKQERLIRTHNLHYPTPWKGRARK